MESIVVKTEMQPNEEILLFYVDEDGGNEQGILTTMDNIEQVHEEQVQQESYVMEETIDSADDDSSPLDQSYSKERWTDEETKKLLIFYNDNKNIFVTGATRKKHLWTIACKTMLSGKNPNSCEMKLRNMKKRYAQTLLDQKHNINYQWPYLELCHQAFHDDSQVTAMMMESQSEPPNIPVKFRSEDEGIVVIKKINSNRPTIDEKVEIMLNMYLKYKKNTRDNSIRNLWETIALEIGEEDANYWHKRFLNFKQHYIRLLDKRTTTGQDNTSWPYLKIFDEIYDGDREFQMKYLNTHNAFDNTNVVTNVEENATPGPLDDWNDTEITVLTKYYFDCFDEFQDPTIPKKFLWHEVGRLIEKSPETCKVKYEELKREHLYKCIKGGYDIRSRIPMAIILDNIISKEIQLSLLKESTSLEHQLETSTIDELVQFLYENIEMFKDPICYFVCWAAIAKKLELSVYTCKKQWDDLTTLYKTILEDKKENPDMQIDWRYIELFDRIFDYGIDTKLLEGYENHIMNKELKNVTGKIGVKKVNIKVDEDMMGNCTEDDESYDERGFTKRSKRSGDSKAFKILEYFHKNKEKFSTTQRKKQALWEILARQIGISAEQCAHRFRNLKQVYTGYIQREISKPEMPILWPYYALCKKVFGYRALKNKLKNGKVEIDSEEWSAKEIKQLINYFGSNFNDLYYDLDNSSKWTTIATQIGKSENSCCEKFTELNKSYNKLKAIRERDPEAKVCWKYYKLFEEIFNSNKNELDNNDSVLEEMEVDPNDEVTYEVVPMNEDVRNGLQGDDDFQCIIFIPEGKDISEAQIITQENAEQLFASTTVESKRTVTKWTKRTKKRLLLLYLNYIKRNKGRDINNTDMWTEIASKLPEKTPLSCRKMFAKLKANHLSNSNEDINKKKTPYFTVLTKILAMKPKFAKTGLKKSLEEGKSYKDVPLPSEKVEQALQYYLLHLEEIISPMYEKKYVWMELANHVSEPVMKIFNKINYLKTNYNIETEEVAGEKTQFGDLLKNILEKEAILKDQIVTPLPIEEDKCSDSWSEDEIEQLLVWYLENLEKFKNPKFVRSYLWIEISNILQKIPLVCSKKMTEIRTQYRNMVKESPDVLSNWKFYELCQKIYGTGKKVNENNS